MANTQFDPIFKQLNAIILGKQLVLKQLLMICCLQIYWV